MGRANFPFHSWLPRPLGIVVLLAMFVPPTLSGGAHLCLVGEMSGALGLWSEDILLANTFTSIGMCLFPPFMVRFLQARRVRQTFLWCFGLLIPLNWVCAVTTSLPTLLAACLLTGFVRIMAMLNCTFTIAPYLTGTDTLAMFTMTEEPTPDVQYMLERKRTFLMPVLYGFILIISQAGNLLMSWVAYAYRWRDAHFATIGLLLVAMLLVAVTMPNEKKTKTWSVPRHMVVDMLLMAVALCSLAFVLIYGKTLDWFASDFIRLAASLGLIAVGLFVLRSSRRGSEAYLPLDVFAHRNVWMSMGLFVLTMVFNSASSIVGSFVKLYTPAGNLDVAGLSHWAIVGCLVGLVLAVGMIAKKAKFRTIFCIGFLLMAAGNAFLFFQFQTEGLLDNMKLPTMLNFAGMLMLYSVVAAFGMKRLPARHLATFVFLMIWMRNAIAPVMGSSVYANWLHREQQHHFVRLSQGVDGENMLAASAFMQAALIAKADGRGSAESGQFATTSLGRRVAVQSSLVAMKDITGHTVMGLLAAACLTLLLPYRKGETT